MMGLGKWDTNNCIIQTVLSLSFCPFSFPLTFAREYLKLKISFSCKRQYLPALPTLSTPQQAQFIHTELMDSSNAILITYSTQSK